MIVEDILKDLLRQPQQSEIYPGVQVTQCGSMLKGRYVGQAAFVFGTNVDQIVVRLKHLQRLVKVPEYRKKEKV